MTISIESYRYNIGIFHLSGRNGQFKSSNKYSEKKMTGRFTLLSRLLLIILLLSSSCSLNQFNLNSSHLDRFNSLPPPNQHHSSSPSYTTSNDPDILSHPWHISSPSWSHQSTSSNRLNHSLEGNRRIGYQIGFWNCRKKLIGDSNFDTHKLTDIKSYFTKHNPHVFAVIESDLFGLNSDVGRSRKYSTEDVKHKLHIEGYQIILPNSWNCHGQARILVYVRDNIKAKVIEDEIENSDLPSISLEIGIGREKKSIVNFFYREWKGGISKLESQPSQKDRLQRQVNHWKKLSSSNRDVLIMGDANLCAHSWDDEDYNLKNLSSTIQDFLLEESFFQLVKKFTRSEIVRGNVISSSCIDHVYSNSPSKCDTPRVEAAGDSDHLAVIVTKFSKELKNKPQTIKKRNYKNFKVDKFLNDVRNSQINEEITALEDLDEAAEKFQDMFGAILDKHAPVKVYQIRKHYVPYLSEEAKLLMEERDCLKTEATQTKDKTLLDEFKNKRNETKEKVEEDRIEYNKKEFEETRSSNDVWKSAYKILGQDSNKAPSQICENGRLINAPEEMANTFNEIFINKVNNIREKVRNHDAKINPIQRLKNWLLQRQNPLPQFEIKTLTKVQLRKVIKRMKGGRSHGVDFIDSYSLKTSYPLIEDAILHLVNLSISKKTYPRVWKVQLVMPLHKKNDKLVGTNYRPVAHIVEVGKIIEYAIHDQVYGHFEEQGLFHPNHHGFLGQHSTATALVQLYDLWLEASEKTELSAALLLDLTAAFDVVDHSILLEKLEAYNFSNETVSWFASYLTNRVQVVQVESKQSDAKILGDFVVPQGSILGPLIFLIFNNDFPASSVEGTSVLFADDDTDNTSDKDPQELQRKIQREADRSTDWVEDNRMACAGDKTKLLIIGTRQLRALRLDEHEEKLKVTVCGNEVESSESEKLLGIIVNNQLTWRHYLSGEKWRTPESDNFPGLFTQLSQRVGMLQKLVRIVPRSKFIMLSQGIFTSKVLYCLQVFGNVWGFGYDESSRKSFGFTLEDSRRLQVLQNKVCRMKTGLGYDKSTKELLAASRDMSIHQLTAYHTLVMVKKIKTNRKPEYLDRRLPFITFEEDAVRPRRQQNKIYVQQTLNISRAGFIYRGSLLWNQLPDQLRCASNLGTFKTKVRIWVEQNVAIKPG